MSAEVQRRFLTFNDVYRERMGMHKLYSNKDATNTITIVHDTKQVDT